MFTDGYYEKAYHLFGMHLFVINIVRADDGLSRPIKVENRFGKYFSTVVTVEKMRQRWIFLQLQNVCLGHIHKEFVICPLLFGTISSGLNGESERLLWW